MAQKICACHTHTKGECYEYAWIKCCANKNAKSET
jgi:hypothetical protein